MLATKSRQQRKQQQLEATAYHEAGHAVMSHCHGRRLKRVDIVEEEDRLGLCRQEKWPPWVLDELNGGSDSPRVNHWIEVQIRILLAGPAAEKQYTGRGNHRGARSDYNVSSDLAMHRCCGTEETNAYMRWLWIGVKAHLRVAHWWQCVEAVAAALLERHRLTGAEVQTIINDTLDADLSDVFLVPTEPSPLASKAAGGRPRKAPAEEPAKKTDKK
jgi:hypothetical protein